MPNLKGGKGHRKSKKSSGATKSRKLILAEAGQCYAEAKKMLGDRRVEVAVHDSKNTIMQARIRGNMRKRQWIRPGDTVLLSLRDFQTGKADIIYQYWPKEYRKLVKLGEIVPVKKTDDVTFDIGVDYDEDDSDDEVDNKVDNGSGSYLTTSLIPDENSGVSSKTDTKKLKFSESSNDDIDIDDI